MTAIFISHRSTDNAEAAALKAWLVEQGHARFFLDFDPMDGIPAGRDWKQEIYEALRRSQALLIVLTPAWLESRWCFAELAIADEKGKAIFVVRVKPTPAGPLFPAIQEVDLVDDRAAGLARLARGLKESGLDPAQSFDWKPDRPIYPGLAAFDVEDAAIFFGRSAESWAAVEALRRLRLQPAGTPKLLLITGASGSGKSSVMRAGIVARLLKDPAGWIVARPFRRGRDAIVSLAEALLSAWPDTAPSLDPAELAERLRGDDGGKALARFAAELRVARQRPDATLVLPIDQAEELLGPDPDGSAGRLLQLLRDGVGGAAQELLAVATLRSDALGSWQTHPVVDGVSGAALRFEAFPLGPMPVERVPELIRGPAQYQDLKIDDDLVAAIHADVRTPDALPLLAYTLERLHRDHARDGRLSLGDYQALGGIEGSVRLQAERAVDLEHLGSAERAALRAAFVPTLVRATASGGFVRQRALREQIDRQADAPIDRLVAARLLATDRDAQGRETLEIAHEALLRVWPTLVAWVADDADRLRSIDALRRAADEWSRGGEKPDFLAHRGQRLVEVQALLNEPRFNRGVGEQERRYLVACEADVQREQREEREAAERELQAARDVAEAQTRRADEQRRGRRWAFALAGISCALAALALVFSYDARTQRDMAERRLESLRLATVAERARSNGDPVTSVLVLLDTVKRTEDDPELQGQMFQVFYDASAEKREAQVLPFPPVEDAVSMPARAVAVSADGRWIAGGFDDGSITVWGSDPAAAPLRLHESNARILSLSITADGNRLAAADADGVVRLWDAQYGTLDRTLTGPARGPVHTVAFSPQGDRLAVGGSDGTLHVWRLGIDEPPVVMRHPEFGKRCRCRVFGVAFSPDGTELAAAYEDRMVRVWNSLTGKRLRSLSGHGSAVRAVAFDPLGTLLASASEDRTVRLWDAATGAARLVLRGHEREVAAVAFAPDGQQVVSASYDKTLRIWDVQGGSAGIVLRSHAQPVHALAVATRELPGGAGARAQIVSASADGTLRVWDEQAQGSPLLLVPPGRTHLPTVFSVAFSPDGERLVSTADDRSVRVWSRDGVQLGSPLDGHTEGVTAAAVAAGGRWIASGAWDRTVRLWPADLVLRDAASLPPLDPRRDGILLGTHDDAVMDVAFDTPGERLLSASLDGTARVWSVAEPGRELLRLQGVERLAGLRAARFSADGTRIVTAHEDAIARLWDAADGTLLCQLQGHGSAVSGASFSPDGRRIVTSSWDETLRVWELPADSSRPCPERPLRVLYGHEGPVHAASYDPGGTRIVSASDDGTVRIWPAEGDRDPLVLRGHNGPVRSAVFSPDGERVASASDDGRVRLWSLEANLTELAKNVGSALPRTLTPRELCRYGLQDAFVQVGTEGAGCRDEGPVVGPASR